VQAEGGVDRLVMQQLTLAGEPNLTEVSLAVIDIECFQQAFIYCIASYVVKFPVVAKFELISQALIQESFS
jgi:hypothetical protein